MKHIVLASVLLSGTQALAENDAYLAMPDPSGNGSVLHAIGDDFLSVDSAIVDDERIRNGLCYRRQNDGFEPSGSLDCYRSYMIDPDRMPLESAALKGVAEFTGGELDEYFRGYNLRDVAGVDYCGERDDCDRIYIAGFGDETAIRRWLEALEAGCVASVNGVWVWNLESRDLIVQDVSCE